MVWPKLLLGLVVAIVLIFLIFFTTQNKEETILIGAIQPLSKNSAAVGEQVRNGIDMAVEEINKNGGINGRPLDVVYEDDQCDTKIAVTAFEKIVSLDKIKIVIGPTCSSNVLSVAPLANERKVLIFTTVASTPKITNAGDYIFRNTPSGTDYSYHMAEFAYNNLSFRKISVLYINQDNGIDYKEAFVKYFEGLGGIILTEESYEPAQTDFRSQLIKIKSQNPDSIFIAGQINHGLAIRQAREIGINTTIIGPVTMETPELLTQAGEAAEGVIYSAPTFDLNKPEIKQFGEKYFLKYNGTLGFRTTVSYDAVMIVAMILKKCGEDVECIKTGLYETKNYNGVSGMTSFDENGDVTKPLAIKTVRNGKFVGI